jgi:hypothetical protein
MNCFMVEVKNKPGELAKLAETIAEKGINITGFTGAACGDTGEVCLLTNDEASTRHALSAARYKVREIELVPTSLDDRPGTLAEAARRLANAGVNILAALPTGMSGGRISLAFATDNPAKARTALAEPAMAGSSR